jgi:preprotein translocase subunit Sss1
VAKIAGAGILLVGFIGFLIFTVMFLMRSLGGIA